MLVAVVVVLFGVSDLLVCVLLCWFLCLHYLLRSLYLCGCWISFGGTWLLTLLQFMLVCLAWLLCLVIFVSWLCCVVYDVWFCWCLMCFGLLWFKFVSWDYLCWFNSDCDCFGHRLIYVNLMIGLDFVMAFVLIVWLFGFWVVCLGYLVDCVTWYLVYGGLTVCCVVLILVGFLGCVVCFFVDLHLYLLFDARSLRCLCLGCLCLLLVFPVLVVGLWVYCWLIVGMRVRLWLFYNVRLFVYWFIVLV